MKLILINLVATLLLLGCSVEKEAVMPFKNLSYSGERLFPLEKNLSEEAFRVWFNNGTSIDRVITVSYDSSLKNQANLVEFGFLVKKGLLKSGYKKFFNEKSINPRSGFESFFHAIDSLGLMSYPSQSSFDYMIDHQPFSFYVVEVKKGSKYNQFYFRTHFPNRSMEVSKEYEAIQRLIFKEFDFDFYME